MGHNYGSTASTPFFQLTYPTHHYLKMCHPTKFGNVTSTGLEDVERVYSKRKEFCSQGKQAPSERGLLLKERVCSPQEQILSFQGRSLSRKETKSI